MADTYGVPASSLSKVSRWWNAKKAAGQVVQPYELEAMYEGEMNALQNTANARRGLSLQAARDAETVKQNEINNRLREEEIDATKQGQLTGALTQAGTTGLGLYLLNGKKNGTDAVNTVSNITDAERNAAVNAGTKPPGTYSTDMTGWNPLKNRGQITNTTTREVIPPNDGGAGFESYPGASVDANGNIIAPEYLTRNELAKQVGSGIGEEASSGLVASEGTSGVPISGAGAGEEAMSGMLGAEGAGSALSTVGSAVSTAMPYVAAAKIGMPILGGILEDITPGEEGSSNVFQQGARITKDDYMRPVEAGYEVITGSEVPQAIQWISNPGGQLMKAVSGSCIIISFIYGRESSQVRVAKVFCAKCMTPERLIGYYQIGRPVVRILTKHPALKSLVQRKMVDPFIRYMKWKTGHGQKVSWGVWAFSRTFLSICRLRFHLGKLNFFPPGAEHCVNSAADNENRWYWMDFIQKHREV